MFVRLTKEFVQAIVHDGEQPGGELAIVQDHTASGDAKRPVYEVAETQQITSSLRQKVLEEIRDFSGTPFNKRADAPAGDAESVNSANAAKAAADAQASADAAKAAAGK